VCLLALEGGGDYGGGRDRWTMQARFISRRLMKMSHMKSCILYIYIYIISFISNRHWLEKGMCSVENVGFELRDIEPCAPPTELGARYIYIYIYNMYIIMLHMTSWSCARD
jgi:hypothetical protein